MSAIDPRKRELLNELKSRRQNLTPDKVALVDELSKRWGMSDAAPSFNDERTATQVMTDQMDAVKRGIPQAITGIPGMIKGAGEAVYDAVTGKGTGKAQEMIKGALAPVTTSARGAAALAAPESVAAPSADEFIQAAEASGANIASILGGEAFLKLAPATKLAVIQKLREGNVPEKLMSGAASARDAVAKVQPGGIPLTKTGVVVQAAKTVARPIVKRAAGAAESIARATAEKGPSVSLTATPQQTSPIERPVPELTPKDMRGDQLGGYYEPFRDTPSIPRPQSTYQAPPEEPGPFFNNMRETAGPSQPIEMTNPPEAGGVAPKPSKMTAPELNRWMNVQPKQMVHGANPAQQILNDGLLGATKEATLENVKTALTGAGEEMQSALQEAGRNGVRIDAEQAVITALDDATKTIGRRTDTAFQTALSNILDDILHKHPDLKQMTPTDVHALKVDVGDAVKWGRGVAYEADLNQVLVDIYKKLNKDIKANVPNIEGLQTRWGNLYQGSKSLQDSIVKDAAGRGTGSKPQTPAERLLEMRRQQKAADPKQELLDRRKRLNL